MALWSIELEVILSSWHCEEWSWRVNSAHGTVENGSGG